MYEPKIPTCPKVLARKLRSHTKQELLTVVMELARYASGPLGGKISGPHDAAGAMRDIANKSSEYLIGLYLDAQNNLLAREEISHGSLNTTRSHPREIFGPAMRLGAYGLILGHNHPGGSLDASSEDIEFTRNAMKASEVLGIEVYDHIIVSRNGFTSMRDSGLLW